MTDRIRDSFETWAQKQDFTDLTQNYKAKGCDPTAN